MTKTDTKAAEAPVTGTAYTKEQLLASKRYANRRDVISVLLEDSKTYTLTEADAQIEKFMKGKVI